MPAARTRLQKHRLQLGSRDMSVPVEVARAQEGVGGDAPQVQAVAELAQSDAIPAGGGDSLPPEPSLRTADRFA